ncbi:MAG: general secretion pathway protein GspK [Hyphomonadaceae bacterium]|nr:general secretion pathway protein GspK [Hyphomonadaceae bacterium]
MVQPSSNAPWTRPASALVMAALAASLMASAAAFLLIEARTARAASGESYRLARAEREAERALAIASVKLDAGETLPSHGEILLLPSGARVLRQDAAGLIDINAASPETLAQLLQGLGESRERAVALSDAIADWRDEDNLVRAHGGERDAYIDAGLAPPANRPFATEGELSAVVGVTPALLECALPFLTTYSGQVDIDAAAAPSELRALLSANTPTQASVGAPLGRVIALRAEAPLSEHASLARTIWVRLTGDPSRPLFIHRAEQSFAQANRFDCGAARS